MLTEKIQQDQLTALKAKDESTLTTLRLLSAELKNKQIDLGHELSDEETMGVIRKQAKQLNDAKEMFEKGGRADLVAENESQIAILSAYLPVEIDDDELRSEVEKVIAANAPLRESSPNALFGVAIKELREKADPSRITRMVKEIVGN